MALPPSGSISMNNVNCELGNSPTQQIGLNDASVRTLFGKPSGAISLSDGRGKTATPVNLGAYYCSYGGYYTGTQCGYYLFATCTACIAAFTNFYDGSPPDIGVNCTEGSPATETYGSDALYPAFKYARDQSAAGFNDWYLGASCEMVQQILNQSCGCQGCCLGWHWTATQGPNRFQAVRILSYNGPYNGLVGTDGKGCGQYVRPLRRSL